MAVFICHEDAITHHRINLLPNLGLANHFLDCSDPFVIPSVRQRTQIIPSLIKLTPAKPAFLPLEVPKVVGYLRASPPLDP